MKQSRIEQFDKAVNMRVKSADAFLDYWFEHSIYTSLEYWIVVGLFLSSLILLAIKIDKSKVFLFGFFGFSIHILTVYMNIIGINKGMWNFPIQMVPLLPALAFDSSLVPVIFMLVFQFTFNNKKNYYLYAILTALFISVLIEPLLVRMEIFKFYGNTTYIHRFFGYVAISFISKFITNLFLLAQKKSIAQQ